MSPEKQRIAIAEACGWKEMPLNNDRRICEYRDSKEWYCYMGKLFVLPDYLNDLNAMHEAEKVLLGRDVETYVTALCLQVQPKPSLWNATAAQRAEAFLRTLGKWEDA